MRKQSSKWGAVRGPNGAAKQAHSLGPILMMKSVWCWKGISPSSLTTAGRAWVSEALSFTTNFESMLLLYGAFLRLCLTDCVTVRIVVDVLCVDYC